jgi:arabinofuranosyltransferase
MTPTQEFAKSREKWLALGAVAVLLTLVVRNAWVTEDAYITLRTIDNLWHGHGLRWNVDERVQAYTHPLWMMLMSVPYALGANAYVSALLVSLMVTLAALLALLYTARTSGHAIAALVLVMLSRSFIDYSTSGLENPLSHLLVAALVWLYVVREAGPLPVALCAALMVINRADTMLIALPPLAHTVLRALATLGFKKTLEQLALGFSPALAWHTFSLFYYGFFVPNTAFAKLNTGLPSDELTAQGLTYLVNAFAWDPALLAILLVGLGVSCARRHLRSHLLALSTILYLAYVVRIGGDFMQGRFLTVPLFLSACLVATSQLQLADPTRFAVLLLPIVPIFFHPSGTDLHAADAGVVDEREFYEASLALSANTRTQSVPRHVWRDVGTGFAVNAKNEPVKTSYNVGLIGYYAGPQVHIVDENALADPLLARLPARYDPGWRIGHYTRHVPIGYVQTIQTGVCAMTDRKLCEYYAKLEEIISGDLWSWSRFKTIAVMNFGGYDYLIDRDQYLYPNVLHEPIANLATPIQENAAWNDPAARVVPPDGIELEVGPVSHAKSLDLSLDGNDSYDLTFKNGATPLATVLSSTQGLGGMRTRTIQTPALAVERGFDRILIRPRAGDRMYAIGYVRLGI